MPPPERSPRGPRSGDRAAEGDASTAPWYCWGAGIPLRGSHLPLEDTAPPFAGAPFASSPFAHPSRKAAIAPAEIYSALPRGFLTR